MLPMGTLMASAMVIGLVTATPSPANRLLPEAVRKILRSLVILAGCWNVFWYSLQHLTEFWGQAALASGLLMVVTGFYITGEHHLPAVLRKAKPVVLFALLCCALLYGITIYQL
ncbi:hypothetical protein ACWJJH_02170 [Endozoicomonadaceae bacterium StTr2]